MIASPTIKGWCPTLLSPMQSGDGWLARVKPTAGRVNADAARIIAEAASRHGNGHIDLTSRSNFQIRGLTPRSAELLAEIIIGHGLASANPFLESVRNVIASPLGPDDPSAELDSHAVAGEVETLLGEERALVALPSKFAVLVDAGGVLPLADVTADIMVRAHGGGLAVQLDGGRLAARASPSTLAGTVRALTLAFLRLAAERRESPRHMRALIMAIGEERIFRFAGLAPVPMLSAPSSRAPSPIGFVPYPGQTNGAFGVGLPFGRIEAEALSNLAGLCERLGDGSLRTTPWRTLLLPGIGTADVEELVANVRSLALIAESTDPRLHIFACVGAPSCQRASVDARADAGRLTATIATTPALTIHVSGCVKSCAHGGPTTLTLVGRDGRYDLVRNGGARGKPSLTGLSIDQAIGLIGSVKGRRP